MSPLGSEVRENVTAHKHENSATHAPLPLRTGAVQRARIMQAR